MATVEDKYNILIKELNLKEYYDKGFMGQGVTIASIESTNSSHGSQVKSTILTYAPKAKVISYNDLYDTSAVGEQNGNAEFPKFVDWCIENKVDIVTSSLDWTCNDDREKEAVKKLYDAGIIFTNSAGNENNEKHYTGNHTWAFDKEILSVGAVSYNMAKNKFDKASFSNYGEVIDVMMEGSATPIKSYFDKNDEDYDYKCEKYGRDYIWSGFNGTSASSPMTAGMLAVYKSANNNLNSKNVFDLINNNYIPLEYKDREYKILKLPKILLEEKEIEMEDNKKEWQIEFEEVWERATKLKVVDGTRKDEPITRNELVVILDRLGLLK